MIRLGLILFALLWINAPWGHSAPHVEIDFSDGISGVELQAFVEKYLEEQGVSSFVEVAALRAYPACDHPPHATPHEGSWNTLELVCNTPISWRRMVRTNASDARQIRHTSASVEGAGLAYVLTQSLSKGTVIEASHIAPKSGAGDEAIGTISDPSNLIGRRIKQNLGVGRLVLARHLEHAWLIEEGEPVAITYNMGGISVLASGESLDNGQRGDVIRVKNRKSALILRATVSGRNKVTVGAKLN